jgi:hypothetical protein
VALKFEDTNWTALKLLVNIMTHDGLVQAVEKVHIGRKSFGCMPSFYIFVCTNQACRFGDR